MPDSTNYEPEPACDPYHGIRIVPAVLGRLPYAVASCPHGWREAHGTEAVKALIASYEDHRATCADTPAAPREQGAAAA